MYTEVGKIADMLANADESQTPLKQSLEQLSKTLTYLIVAIALVTFLVSVFIRGEQPLEGLMVAVALAVAAIPEGLPAIVTILLSLGTTTLLNAIRLFVNCQQLKPSVQLKLSHLIRLVP